MGIDLIGKKVVHKAFGEGVVIAHEHRENAEDVLQIDFSGTIKPFMYDNLRKDSGTDGQGCEEDRGPPG